MIIYFILYWLSFFLLYLSSSGPFRLKVRTSGFQLENMSSILIRAMTFYYYLILLSFFFFIILGLITLFSLLVAFFYYFYSLNYIRKLLQFLSKKKYIVKYTSYISFIDLQYLIRINSIYLLIFCFFSIYFILSL